MRNDKKKYGKNTSTESTIDTLPQLYHNFLLKP